MQNHLELCEFFQHMNWADALMWKAVFKLPDTKNNWQLRKLLYHIHQAQYLYLHLWTQQPLEFPERSDFKHIAEISQWGYQYHQQVSAFLTGIEEDSLNKTLPMPLWAAARIEERIGKAPQPVTLAQTMLQVVFHSTYHRGQVNRHLCELEVESPLTDFIAWIWLGKPQIQWPGCQS